MSLYLQPLVPFVKQMEMDMTSHPSIFELSFSPPDPSLKAALLYSQSYHDSQGISKSPSGSPMKGPNPLDHSTNPSSPSNSPSLLGKPLRKSSPGLLEVPLLSKAMSASSLKPSESISSSLPPLPLVHPSSSSSPSPSSSSSTPNPKSLSSGSFSSLHSTTSPLLFNSPSKGHQSFSPSTELTEPEIQAKIDSLRSRKREIFTMIALSITQKVKKPITSQMITLQSKKSGMTPSIKSSSPSQSSNLLRPSSPSKLKFKSESNLPPSSPSLHDPPPTSSLHPPIPTLNPFKYQSTQPPPPLIPTKYQSTQATPIQNNQNPILIPPSMIQSTQSNSLLSSRPSLLGNPPSYSSQHSPYQGPGSGSGPVGGIRTDRYQSNPPSSLSDYRPGNGSSSRGNGMNTARRGSIIGHSTDASSSRGRIFRGRGGTFRGN